MPAHIKDLTGKKFTRLTVLGIYGRVKRYDGTLLYWSCVCECGTVKAIQGNDLKSGKVKSCGCLMRELNANSLRCKTLQRGK